MKEKVAKKSSDAVYFGKNLAMMLIASSLVFTGINNYLMAHEQHVGSFYPVFMFSAAVAVMAGVYIMWKALSRKDT